MPLVIDANAANALSVGGCTSSKRILEWVRTKGTVVSGGLLQKELGKTKLAALLTTWSSAGRLKTLPDDNLDEEILRIQVICESNDAHVLAVVSVGNALVVVTGDQLLMGDLKNVAITGRKRKIISHDGSSFSKDSIVQALLRQCE